MKTEIFVEGGSGGPFQGKAIFTEFVLIGTRNILIAGKYLGEMSSQR